MQNPRAVASVLVGILGILMVPLGVVLAQETLMVTLLTSGSGSIPAGAILGVYAVILARRGREEASRRVVRGTGRRIARIGRLLGIVSICLAASAALAVGFYGLLTLFAQ